MQPSARVHVHRTRTDDVLRAMNGGKRLHSARCTVHLRYVRVRIRVATGGAAGAERDRSAAGGFRSDDGIPVGSLYWRATNSITFLLLRLLYTAMYFMDLFRCIWSARTFGQKFAPNHLAYRLYILVFRCMAKEQIFAKYQKLFSWLAAQHVFGDFWNSSLPNAKSFADPFYKSEKNSKSFGKNGVLNRK